MGIRTAVASIAVFLATMSFLYPLPVAKMQDARERRRERTEQARLAVKYDASPEVVLSDGTRCDLLSDKYAIEIDWPEKWAEAIGQSLHYAEMTDRKPAVILLLRDPGSEWRHLVRCAVLCGKHGIRFFVEEIK